MGVTAHRRANFAAAEPGGLLGARDRTHTLCAARAQHDSSQAQLSVAAVGAVLSPRIPSLVSDAGLSEAAEVLAGATGRRVSLRCHVSGTLRCTLYVARSRSRTVTVAPEAARKPLEQSHLSAHTDTHTHTQHTNCKVRVESTVIPTRRHAERAPGRGSRSSGAQLPRPTARTSSSTPRGSLPRPSVRNSIFALAFTADTQRLG